MIERYAIFADETLDRAASKVATIVSNGLAQSTLRTLPNQFTGNRKAQEVNDLGGGADGDRTRDLLTASQALSQLSYSPTSKETQTTPTSGPVQDGDITAGLKGLNRVLGSYGFSG